MKHLITLGLITCLLNFLPTSTHAQDEEEKRPTPQWVSDKGYWNVVSNKKTPKEATVYFYNNDHVLVYKEEIRNQKLKLGKKKTLLRLKSVPEEAVISYANGNWTNPNNLLAVRLQQ